MMYDRRILSIAVPAVGVRAARLIGAASAQDSDPSRTITLLVPFPPGGSVRHRDPADRGEGRREALKQTVVIDNRPGGGGNVAALVDQAGCDRTATRCSSTNMGVMSVNPILFSGPAVRSGEGLRSRSRRSFRFRTSWSCPPTARRRTWPSWRPGPRASRAALSFGSQGVGSGGQIIGEMFKGRVGAPMVHVPYRGAAPAATEVMSRPASTSCSRPTSRRASRPRAASCA